VRQGELKVTEAGNGWSESLDNALAALDRKLTKVAAPPRRRGPGPRAHAHARPRRFPPSVAPDPAPIPFPPPWPSTRQYTKPAPKKVDYRKGH
jgi:hypothetical protein